MNKVNKSKPTKREKTKGERQKNQDQDAHQKEKTTIVSAKRKNNDS